MENSKKKGKSSSETSRISKPNGSSDSSSDYSGSKKSGKGRNNASASFVEESSISRVTESGSSKYKTAPSFDEGASITVYSGTSEMSRKSEKRRQKNPSSSMQEETSSGLTDASVMTESKERNKPQFMNAPTAVYAANIQGASFVTTDTFVSEPSSGLNSSDQSGGTTASKGSRGKEKVRLMPFKVKDVMEMLQNNPEYKDKTPVMIKVKENDIDQILEGKPVIRGKAEPLDEFLHPSPHSAQAVAGQESFRMAGGAESGRSRSSRESAQRPEKPYEPMFAGADTSQKVYAMHDIQAFPVVQTVPSRRRVRRTARPVSRRSRSRPRRRVRSRTPVVRVPPRRRTTVRRVARRPYRRPYLSPCTPYPMCDAPCAVYPVRRPYRRPRSRVVTPRRAVSQSVSRVRTSRYNNPYAADDRGSYYASDTESRVVTAPRSRVFNTPYTSDYRGIYYSDDRSVSRHYVRSTVSGFPGRVIPHRANCCCNLCEEKLKFIQPGLCSKKKNVWTNEYAVIPKPQIHLIDPCEELDPCIYPRADNPCIRDGQGNPLTDCIGRPLRSPIGKKFLSFSANGSVMETSIRGNFWTGQPPLCVKCPMPTNSCGQDTTHNWWMSCGYPILPNMTPFYQRVLANEMGPC